MPNVWMVQEKIEPVMVNGKKSFDKTSREVYVKLLERIIENIQKTKPGYMPLDKSGRTEDTYPFDAPTVIFSELLPEKAQDYITLRMVCFTDMADFRALMNLYEYNPAEQEPESEDE